MAVLLTFFLSLIMNNFSFIHVLCLFFQLLIMSFFLFMQEKGKTQGVDNINKDYSHITHQGITYNFLFSFNLINFYLLFKIQKKRQNYILFYFYTFFISKYIGRLIRFFSYKKYTGKHMEFLHWLWNMLLTFSLHKAIFIKSIAFHFLFLFLLESFTWKKKSDRDEEMLTTPVFTISYLSYKQIRYIVIYCFSSTEVEKEIKCIFCIKIQTKEKLKLTIITDPIRSLMRQFPIGGWRKGYHNFLWLL